MPANPSAWSILGHKHRYPLMFHFVRETRADSLSSCWIRYTVRAARREKWNIADYPKVLWRGPMLLRFQKPQGLAPGFNMPELRRRGAGPVVAKELNIA